MEDSLNKRYVNISERKFTHAVYNNEDSKTFSYKPTGGAFWLSLESKEGKCYSEWDEMYAETFQADEKGNLHATTVKFKPTTYIFSPEIDKTILEGFNNFISSKKDLTPDQKRKLLVELVRQRTGNNDIEHVICQIDMPGDMRALEEIFGGYKLGNSHPDEVYDNLSLNVQKGIRESFSGLEVTAAALGLDDNFPEEGVDELQAYWSTIDSKYHETIDFFDMASVAIFDTSCLDIVSEKEYSKQAHLKEIKEANREEVEL